LGVACTRAICSLTDLPAQIKWPNDVVVEGRKLAGMLVETTTMGSVIDVAVCGLGINVYLTKDEIPLELRARASSLAIESEGRPVPSRSVLLARIVDEIEALYPAVTGDATPLLAEATALSAVLGSDVVVRFVDGSSITGRADSFDDAGGLRIATATELATVRVGEIEQLRAADA
jgi:BirA family biotin operon repressor/biotin-[acetyl-CoA-carboxylase] ligase